MPLMPMGLYHPIDGATNHKYKLLYFLTPNKKIQEKGTGFLLGQMLPSSDLFTVDYLPLTKENFVLMNTNVIF